MASRLAPLVQVHGHELGGFHRLGHALMPIHEGDVDLAPADGHDLDDDLVVGFQRAEVAAVQQTHDARAFGIVVVVVVVALVLAPEEDLH